MMLNKASQTKSATMTILRNGARRFFSRRSRCNRRRIGSGAALAGCRRWLYLPAAGRADTFRIQPSISILETLTNNVNLSPLGARKDLQPN
jgi:hypothetical protein